MPEVTTAMIAHLDDAQVMSMYWRAVDDYEAARDREGSRAGAAAGVEGASLRVLEDAMRDRGLLGR